MITFNDIPVVQASCLISREIKWFAQLPWSPIDFKGKSHLVGTHSLSHTLDILDTLTSSYAYTIEAAEDDDNDDTTLKCKACTLLIGA